MGARWTDSDNLNGREALAVGGPLDGMRIVVNRRGVGGDFRYPDVVGLDGYEFDPHTWRFVWTR